jgi:hypothetical protein
LREIAHRAAGEEMPVARWAKLQSKRGADYSEKLQKSKFDRVNG